MSERIYKLQPDRTIHLRGFDGLGAAAALHSATASSFKVSGVFRDPADFCVLYLYDRDNFYEHPSIKYLPDDNFEGLTLTFDVHYSGLRTLDSPRYPSIDWPYLDVIPTTGDPFSIPLFDHAQLIDGTWTPATASFTIIDNGFKEYDRLTLWYLNFGFDAWIPKIECAYLFDPRGAGFTHSITIAGVPYSYVEAEGDDGAAIAQHLVAAISACPLVTARRGDNTMANGPFNLINLGTCTTDGLPFDVSSTAATGHLQLFGVTASTVAASLAGQINGVDWAHLAPDMPISAHAEGPVIHLTAVKPGVDGNAITMYAISKNDRLMTAESVAPFTGGASDATWRITLDLASLGAGKVRQMWLTFAPPVSTGQPFEATEWEASFTNWTVAGPEPVRMLQVAGPGSVRIEENEAACAYDGAWNVESGFYSKGYAKASSAAGDSVTVRYYCASTHELYLGTSLYTDRGSFRISLDGDAETELPTRLAVDSQVNTRRGIRSSVAPGHHTLKLTVKGDGVVYYDFLEAAIPSDVPDNLPSRTNISPALDYSTDHTYKLSPARLLWIFDKLGLAGPMNQYLGVFWWNQRALAGATIPHASVTFDGQFVDGDRIRLTIGGQDIWKNVFPDEDGSTFARHFEYFINAAFVGIRASATGNALTITSHSATDHYRFTFDSAIVAMPGSTGALAVDNHLNEGAAGEWRVDTSQTPALNRAARDWHADLYAECQARGREIVTAASMELVLPPEELPARWPNGDPVKTDMGFNSLKSSHCAFSSAMQTYQRHVFDCIAGLMSNAGLTPNLQLGEFCWWYFKGPGGMAFYDPETIAAAQTALGRPLHTFLTADDDPTVNDGADALFLRNRLRDYVAELTTYLRGRYPDCQFEVLFPYDVNYPTVAGVNHLGGRLIRFINLPVEWERKETAGFDRLKMEGLDFGANSRDLNLAKDVIRMPFQLGWPCDSVRYMIPVFNGGCPWIQEYRFAIGCGIPVVNLWAFDHVCIFGWPVTEPSRRGRALRFG